ncbi:phytyl ester synthase 1, chloroplastic isoform X3 [Arachis hypogaea]|uniref:phytyl ester synthase 1, chloroplastic isoform X3 n=1 Tax=Arachis hypogaea TaxID=3818 RepID=UPI000DED1D93|nr:acyltransferase-like protein At1g54570, chloroplastic isoform X2 [Arachis hypogaea]
MEPLTQGKEYKVIWPDHPEFVRMAARFGATIVPFGTVGEDDIADILLDFNDLAKIPYFIEYVRELQRGLVKFRDEISGEVASRDIAPPLILPKLPGRFYYLFGKPISTKGMENMLKDREAANKLYLQIKSEVENNMCYLLKKRQEDLYRNFIDKRLYQTLYPRSESDQTPTFKI